MQSGVSLAEISVAEEEPIHLVRDERRRFYSECACLHWKRETVSSPRQTAQVPRQLGSALNASSIFSIPLPNGHPDREIGPQSNGSH